MTVSEEISVEPNESPVASSAGIVAAAILCVVLAVWAIVVGWFGIFAVNTGACEVGCNWLVTAWSRRIAEFLPPLLAVVAIIFAIRRGVERRRFSWIFPLVALFIVLIPYHIGHSIGAIVNHTPWL